MALRVRELWKIAVAAASLAGCRTVPPGLIELDTLDIVGNETLSDGEIEEKLLLKPSSWIPLWGQQRYFDDTILADDLERIVRLYESHGIFGTTARVKSLSIAGASADVVIEVKEGRAVRVSQVRVEGYPVGLPRLASREGERFDEDDYEADKATLASTLAESGFPFAQVQGEVLLDRVREKVEVRFRVEPGRFYRVGSLRVEGSRSVDEERLRHATRIVVGAPVRASALEAARNYLLQLGIFSLVKVEAGPEPPSGEALPVVISVTEGPAQTLGVGAGFAVDNQQQMINGRLMYRHNNFLGGLRQLSLEARPSYIFSPNVLEPEADGWGGETSASFLQPDFLVQKGLDYVGFVSSARYRREFRVEYATQSGLARVGFLWPQHERSNVEVGLDVEVFSIESFPKVIAPQGCVDLCVLGYLDQKVVLDRRDALVQPSRGWYGRVSLAEAGLFGDFSFFMVEPEIRAYFPLGKDLVLATRAEGGVLRPWEGESPVVKRFFGGGPNHHRGFAQGELSPVVETRGGRRVRVGGDSTLLASAEGRYRLIENLFGALFVDAGDVQESWLPVLRPERFHYAVGVGGSYATPVAPIRLDVAYRLNTPRSYRERNLGRFAFQLNFGESF